MGISDEKIIRYIPEHLISELDKLYAENYKNVKKPTYWSDSHEKLTFEKPLSCTSMICNQAFFDYPFVQFWSDKYTEGVMYHRKLWELVYICQALYENGMLEEGKKGVVFGVGEEPLPDLFASMGCKILATDLSIDEANAKGWVETEQNAGGDYKKLSKYGFCDEEEFLKRVQIRDVNMNDIPKDIRGYDFCWSACALEHIGGIRAGLDFIKNSLDTLNPGGLAIHTTEYNLYSNKRTYESPELSLFRRCDIELLIDELQEEGHYVYPMDWHTGEGVVDNFVDLPPFSKKDMHLRLKPQEFPCTSIGLIIRKNV